MKTDYTKEAKNIEFEDPFLKKDTHGNQIIDFGLFIEKLHNPIRYWRERALWDPTNAYNRYDYNNFYKDFGFSVAKELKDFEHVIPTIAKNDKALNKLLVDYFPNYINEPSLTVTIHPAKKLGGGGSTKQKVWLKDGRKGWLTGVRKDVATVRLRGGTWDVVRLSQIIYR